MLRPTVITRCTTFFVLQKSPLLFPALPIYLHSIYRASRPAAAMRAPAAPRRSPAALEDWEAAAEERAADADEAAEAMALVALVTPLEEPLTEAQT